MATPNNLLINVQTYNDAMLAALQNQNAFAATSNSRFENFQNIPGQLGQTVTYDRMPRVVATESLVASWQSADQRILSLTCNQPYSVSLQFTDEQVVFNDVRTYMKKWGLGAVMELGASVESFIADVCRTTPYRFYGDGVTAINSYFQLASVVTEQKSYGSAGEFRGYIPIEVSTAVINSGLNQFVIDRNETTANSWELGRFSGATWYTSNLLPVHEAGSAGDTGKTLRVVSTTTDANGAVVSILFESTTAAINDLDFIHQYDRFQFNDGVASVPNIRFRTFTGHKPSSLRVQFLATAAAATNGSSQVTVNITPPLQALATNEQNITVAIVPGMEVDVMPSCRVGMLTTGDPLFVAMPALPNTSPFTSARAYDKDTGVGLRTYHGYLIGQAASGIVHDLIVGKSLDPDYATAILFPL